MDRNFTPKYINVEQGSPEWLEWRKSGGFGGSESSAVMGTSPWMDATELYYRKLGLLPDIEVNDAMRRGSALEPIARIHFEMETGISMPPACMEHPDLPFLMASLDGISSDGKAILEIKAPGLKTHKEALDGKIKPYYYTQIQHCLAVSNADVCYYYSYTDLPGVEPTKLIKVVRDEDKIDRLIHRLGLLWEYVQKQEEPDPTFFAAGDAGLLNGDTRSDPAWLRAIDEFKSAYDHLSLASRVHESDPGDENVDSILVDAKSQFELRCDRISELMQRKRQMVVRGSGIVVTRVLVDGAWTIRVEGE